MKIRIVIDQTLEEDEIVLSVKQMSGSIDEVVRELNADTPLKINGICERETHLVAIADIEYFFTGGQKVFFKACGREFEVKQKIYELENTLPANFVKINQGVIANTGKMKSVRTLINGTMEVTFLGGGKEYVSRRSVALLRKALEV